MRSKTPECNVPHHLHKTDPISVLKVHGKELKYRVLHSQPVSPVNVESLEILLHGYNPALTQYLIEGFSLGFRINFVGDRCAMDFPNLKSAFERLVVTSAKLQKECDAGRIVGLFATPTFSNFRTSPIGLVPKKRSFRISPHPPLILSTGHFCE